MVQRGEHPRFSLETCKALLVLAECFGKHLDGHLTAELRILRPIDLAHPALADGLEDLVVAKSSAGTKCHGEPLLASAEISSGQDLLGGKITHSGG